MRVQVGGFSKFAVNFLFREPVQSAGCTDLAADRLAISPSLIILNASAKVA